MMGEIPETAHFGAILILDEIHLLLPDIPLRSDPGIRGMLAKQVVGRESRPILDPPDWAAFTLLSIGSVTMLYSVALPKNT